MKTVVSIPDQLFKEAERFARRIGKSRSRLYTEAIWKYLARHSPDRVTKAMNEACARVKEEDFGFARCAARKILKRMEW